MTKLFAEGNSVLLFEVTAPVVASRHREHRFELHFLIDLEGEGLRCMAAAFTGIFFKSVPEGAGLAGTGSSFRFHNRERLLKRSALTCRPNFGRAT